MQQLATLIQKIYRGWRCRTHYQQMRKSQILISSWFRGTMVPVTPKVPSPHSTRRVGNGRGGSGGGPFLTGPLFPTAKEALWEDEGVSIVDPGFCERVEGNGKGKRVPSPHVVPFELSQLLGGGRSRKQVLLEPRPYLCAMACLRLGISGPAPCVSGSVAACWEIRTYVWLCLLL